MASERIKSKVYGVTHSNPDGSDRQKIIRKHCRAGMPLALIAEPDNPHSDSAIGVWLAAGVLGKPAQIGYVRDGLAQELGDRLAAGCSISATVLEVTGGPPKGAYGVNYEIRVDGDFDGGESSRQVTFEINLGGNSGRHVEPVPSGASDSSSSSGGCCGCLALVVIAVAGASIWSWISERKRGGVDEPGFQVAAPAPIRPEAPKIQPEPPPVDDPTPAPITVEEAPEPEPSPEPVGPPKPRHSTRAATMLQSSRNIAKLGNREGAIASYRDVVIKFPDTVEANEALRELKRLGGEPPSPEEINAVE